MRIYTTCPQSKDIDRRDYLRRVVEISQWSEEFDCEGMLIYTDNGLVDPWLVAQVVVENTKRLMPLVAVQPVYMHPYSRREDGRLDRAIFTTDGLPSTWSPAASGTT